MTSTENTLSAPVVFITTFTIKSGKLEPFQALLGELLQLLEAEEPGALAVNAYLNADRTEASIVQLAPDEGSIKRFWQLLHQRTGRSLEDLANTSGVQVYGSLGSGSALERTRHSAGSGATVTVMPQYVGGFTRQGQTDGSRP